MVDGNSSQETHRVLLQNAKRRVTSAAKERSLLLTDGLGEEDFPHFPAMPNINCSPTVHLAVAQPELVQPTTKMNLDGLNSLVWIGKGTSLNHCNFIVRGRNNIIVIAESCRLKQLTIEIKGDSNAVVIGKETTVEHAAVICGRNNRSVLVGDDCMISSNVMMRTNDGHGIFDIDSKNLINSPSDVVVHAHVWIGNGARLNKGCIVGSGSVIGQLSVLSGTAEPNCIYAGIPARKLRSGIVWSRTDNFADIPDRFVVSATAEEGGFPG